MLDCHDSIVQNLRFLLYFVEFDCGFIVPSLCKMLSMRLLTFGCRSGQYKRDSRAKSVVKADFASLSALSPEIPT